jgi:hypothetical protein
MKKLTPNQTVKAQCQECLGMNQFNKSEVENCKGDTCFTGLCPFFPYRLGRRISVKVFRAFCIHCMGGQAYLVPDCPSTGCKVYPYRMGKNPSKKGQGDVRNFNKKDRDWTFNRQGTVIDVEHIERPGTAARMP